MSGTLAMIGFDADDTLWYNETLYARSQEEFARLLAPYHEPSWIAQRLHATEMRNLKQFGYGIKGFTLSMIETAIELTEGRIQGHEIQAIIDLAREMLQAPVDLLPGVQPALERLSRRYPLLLITKGDLFDQTTKIARSGLADYFQQVEVVPEKDEATYRQILQRQGVAPEHFLMVGNSLRSDILPVVAIGGQAVHIPYAITWQHEAVQPPPHLAGSYHQLEHMAALPDLLEAMEQGNPGQGPAGLP